MSDLFIGHLLILYFCNRFQDSSDSHEIILLITYILCLTITNQCFMLFRYSGSFLAIGSAFMDLNAKSMAEGSQKPSSCDWRYLLMPASSACLPEMSSPVLPSLHPPSTPDRFPHPTPTSTYLVSDGGQGSCCSIDRVAQTSPSAPFTFSMVQTCLTLMQPQLWY